MAETQKAKSSMFEIFKNNSFMFNKQLEDVSQKESIIQHDSGCNPLNWIAGHIVLSRDALFLKLEIDPICDERYKLVYDYNTSITDAPPVDITELIEVFNNSQKTLLEAVKASPVSEFDEKATFTAFHETYHVGQFALVRKLLGKEGAIQYK